MVSNCLPWVHRSWNPDWQVIQGVAGESHRHLDHHPPHRRPGLCSAVHYVHFVKYDDAVSFYDAVSDTIRRRGGNRGIFTEEGVDTVAYFGGNHGSRV